MFNIRYNDNWNAKSMREWVRGRVDEIAREIGADVTLKLAGTGDVFLTKPGALVEAMQDAIRDVTGATAELSTSGGTSDARFIQASCPVIEFGLVNQTIHQVDEHVEVADLVKLSEIYERFIEGYFERGGL